MTKFVFIILIFLSVKKYSQTTILNANFNNGIPVGWQMIDNDQLTPNNSESVSFMTNAWNVVENPDSTGIGDSVLMATSWFESSGTADNYLISPAVTLSNFGNYIYFDLKSLDASNPDGFQVLYSTSGTNIDDFVVNNIVFDSASISPYWTRYVVNLDEHNLNNQTIYFAFRHYATDKFILALDNINITINDPVPIKTTEKEMFSFYPNPANNYINIKGVKENTKCSIINLRGEVIKKIYITNGLLLLDIPAGVYFIKVNNIRKKIVVI